MCVMILAKRWFILRNELGLSVLGMLKEVVARRRGCDRAVQLQRMRHESSALLCPYFHPMKVCKFVCPIARPSCPIATARANWRE